MKIRLLLNGEPTDYYKVGKYDYDMHDIEYTINMEISPKNLKELENILNRLVDNGSDIFNYSIIIK